MSKSKFTVKTFDIATIKIIKRMQSNSACGISNMIKTWEHWGHYENYVSEWEAFLSEKNVSAYVPSGEESIEISWPAFEDDYYYFSDTVDFPFLHFIMDNKGDIATLCVSEVAPKDMELYVMDLSKYETAKEAHDAIEIGKGLEKTHATMKFEDGEVLTSWVEVTPETITAPEPQEETRAQLGVDKHLFILHNEEHGAFACACA